MGGIFLGVENILPCAFSMFLESSIPCDGQDGLRSKMI
jgi:hypothetical protein